jgi:hypothetical protein
MKSASLISIVFAVSALLFAQDAKAASAVTAFDGNWLVTLNTHQFKNPDGTIALGGLWRFRAKVKNGVFHGGVGTRDAPNWYDLYGKIEANGTATLHTSGTTGNNPKYTVFHLRPNVPYEYKVLARTPEREKSIDFVLI